LAITEVLLALLFATAMTVGSVALLVSANRMDVSVPSISRPPSAQSFEFVRPTKKLSPKPKVRSVPAAPRLASYLRPAPSLLEPMKSGFVQTTTSELLPAYVGEGELIFKEDAVDIAPVAISRIAPSYPRVAKQQGIEGFVEFRIQVGTTGRVENLWVLRSKPKGIFERAAETALRDFTFRPAEVAGQPVASFFRQRMNFSLRRQR
jgi:protein TonB